MAHEHHAGVPGGTSAIIQAGKTIVYGSVAGILSKILEHPFDLVKVRLQSQVLDSAARFNGPIDCFYKTWKYEGFRGLYRGLPAPIVGAMAENASIFLSYRELQNLITRITHRSPDERLPLYHLALAAAGAGAITSFFLTPIELVKCKMQVQQMALSTTGGAAGAAVITGHPQKLPGPISVLTSILRTTGFRGLWLGQMGTLIRETGGGAAWFGTKEYVASLLVARRKRHRHEEALALGAPSTVSATKLKPWESAVSGACAGFMFNLVLFPADTVKSAMQTEDELRPNGNNGRATQRATFFGTLKAMYQKQGIRGLYAGCGITVARSIPSSAIIFLTVDGLEKRFG